MRFTLSLLLSLSTLLATCVAQQQQPTSGISVNCLRFPPLVAGNATFKPDAITALSQALSNNSYNPPLPTEGITLKPGYSSRVGWADSGGYQICVQNRWFFKTLTVPLDTLSQVVASIKNSCCDDPNNEGTSTISGTGGRRGLCQDARATVPASDGSNVRIVAQNYGSLCCGFWGC